MNKEQKDKSGISSLAPCSNLGQVRFFISYYINIIYIFLKTLPPQPSISRGLLILINLSVFVSLL